MPKSDSRDADAVADIVEWALRAMGRLRDVQFEQFAEDEALQDATIRCLEVIGEAAGRMSRSGRNAFPSMPWIPMVGMRNRLIHEYGNVDLEEVWRTVTEDLPRIVGLLGTG